jgi:hypothetical protein
LDSRKCIEIYEYCQSQYAKLEKKDKCYSTKHDRLVMSQAAKQFRMSEETIGKAYDLASHVLLKAYAKKRPMGIIFN